jgi:hypothetical protein
MHENLKLFYDLDTVANKGGKGSAVASLKHAVANNKQLSRCVGFVAQTEGNEYLIAIRHPNDVIDVVLVNNIPKTKVLVPRIEKNPASFSKFAQDFLALSSSASISILSVERIVAVLNEAASVGNGTAEDLRRYVAYIQE